jgi:hypothetical protein
VDFENQHLLPQQQVCPVSLMGWSSAQECTIVEHLLPRQQVPAIQQVKNLSMDPEMPDFWPSQPGGFKNQHLLPRQQVSKNHIIDSPPCMF